MASTQPARGTRDFLPAEIRRREHVIAVVRRVYERYGFEPLETPAFENIETLVGKYGEEGAKLIFKILKRGEHEGTGQADLALRYRREWADHHSGSSVPNTGGHLVSAALNWAFRPRPSIDLQLSVELPLFEEVRGMQLRNQVALFAAFGLRF
jgi:hypothetical protein